MGRSSRETVKETASSLGDDFRFLDVDTSAAAYGSPEQTVTAVLDFIITLIEEQLAEEILSVPRDEIVPYFGSNATLRGDEAIPILELFRSGDFAPRTQVESDRTRVQALPVAVVRNATGDVLRLRRRERSDSKSKLHEELVVWAGGHVRREDGASGDPLSESLARELQEELRISVEKAQFRFLGAVFLETGESMRKHVALVYEWRAITDDIAVVLSSAEFFERRGTSLSGKFVSLSDLTDDVRSGRLSEPWSTEIVGAFLAEGESLQSRLI